MRWSPPDHHGFSMMEYASRSQSISNIVVLVSVPGTWLLQSIMILNALLDLLAVFTGSSP